jgi:anti-anti-sigma factor
MPRGNRPLLQIVISRDDVVTTATVTGELDISSAPDLTEVLLETLRVPPERLVLDLSGLVFLDVAGARAIAELDWAIRANCAVTIRGMRPSARRVFTLTGQLARQGLTQPLAADGVSGQPPEAAGILPMPEQNLAWLHKARRQRQVGPH